MCWILLFLFIIIHIITKKLLLDYYHAQVDKSVKT